jgi:hypothetical protein
MSVQEVKPKGAGKAKPRKDTSSHSRGRLVLSMVGRAFGNPIPMSADLVFRYSDRFTIDPGASGAAAVHFFSANGMYDPDITGTGHQPLGFDQWLPTFYNHYCVYKSLINVTYFSQNGGAVGSNVVFLGISDDTTTSTVFNTYVENPSYKHSFMSALGGGHDIVTLSHGCNLPKQFGMDLNSYLASDNKRGTPLSNPSEQSYYVVGAAAPNASSNSDVIACFVEMIFHARLTERAEIPAS